MNTPSRSEVSPPSLDAGLLAAEVVELEYAGPHRSGLGRDTRGCVVVPLNATLPRRCFKTGMTDAEAERAGRRLIEIDKRLYWAPGWITVLAVIGLVIFMPLLIVGVVLYFVLRKKVIVRLAIRRDVRWRRVVCGYILALAAVASLIVGFVVALETEAWWAAAAGIFAAVLAAVIAATYGRIVGVKKVENNWAHLSGAGAAFMEREQFDFATP